jgi:hypothetical protein
MMMDDDDDDDDDTTILHDTEMRQMPDIASEHLAPP